MGHRSNREVSGKPPRLRACGLVVARGTQTLAGPVDFTLEGGGALLVTGRNGAGKSTLLRTLFGLLPPGAGRVELGDIVAPDGEPARTLGEAAHYLGHRNAMKGTESVARNLLFWKLFLGGAGLEPAEALRAVDLSHAADLPLAYLSAGQQRRAALARLLVARRPVWLLDEPTAALDTASQALFARLAAEHLAGGGILVAATHLPLGIEAPELALTPPGPMPDLAAEAAEAWT